MEEIFFRKLGKGKPVILIHGFCETHEIWNGLTESLAETFEVFSIDLPGFGQSQLPPAPFTLTDIAKKVLQWIELEKITLPFVVGHSLGGYITLAMAEGASEKMGGLCLFHSTPYPDSEEKKTNRNRVIDFVKVNGVGPFVDTFVPGLFFDKKHPAIPVVDKIARETSPGTLLAYTAAMRDRPSSIGFFKNFEKPLLILAGDKDTVISSESVQEYGRLVKNGLVQILNDAGHMAMFEQPERVRNILTGFLSAV
jgi:pimeloyl-ACP methyl ester carboxylesterase